VRGRVFLILLLLCGPAAAEQSILVAVSGNFSVAGARLAEHFQQQTGISVRTSNASSGRFYAQIVNGAPFDVFLAANADYPARLEDKGHAVAGSRFTYATGSLVIYSSTVDDCYRALTDKEAGFVAVGNPGTSPYGDAASTFIERGGLREAVSGRLVYGENILQALQYAVSGNAVVAIAAKSHVNPRDLPSEPTCVVDVPRGQYDPILQQAVLLTSNRDAARRFLEFLKTEEAREIIRQEGYEVPE
jgi:molybdate transport system substrate-binding protein